MATVTNPQRFRVVACAIYFGCAGIWFYLYSEDHIYYGALAIALGTLLLGGLRTRDLFDDLKENK